MLHCVSLFVLGAAVASQEQPKKSEVSISLTNVESPQPVGCPLVLELKVTNVGKGYVGWWSGGPGAYPGAQYFVVEVRYNGYDEGAKWQPADATNGQYTQGSGRNVGLAAGESVRVPIAVPIQKAGVRDVDVRVRPRHWDAATPAECTVVLSTDRTDLDRYRARLIAAAITQNYCFEWHLAVKYADEATLGVLAKMLEVDNSTVAAGVVDVLARQRELPTALGEPLAAAVRLWGVDTPLTRLGVPQQSVFWTALRTRSEPARRAVLDLLKSTDPQLLARTAESLSESPGDADWLRRARDAVAGVEKAAGRDPAAAKSIAEALKRLDERIRKP